MILHGRLHTPEILNSVRHWKRFIVTHMYCYQRHRLLFRILTKISFASCHGSKNGLNRVKAR
uniref:Candidate secreted effector n=1 Tax=Meloidogyne incognita TaxID=6306 RepID=A0A914LUK6_MELIC